MPRARASALDHDVETGVGKGDRLASFFVWADAVEDVRKISCLSAHDSRGLQNAAGTGASYVLRRTLCTRLGGILLRQYVHAGVGRSFFRLPTGGCDSGLSRVVVRMRRWVNSCTQAALIKVELSLADTDCIPPPLALVRAPGLEARPPDPAPPSNFDTCT